MRVMAAVQPGLCDDFDRVHELVNKHVDVSTFLGHGPSGVDYQLQPMVDQIRGLQPERLGLVNAMGVGSGQAMAKKAGRALAG